MMSKYFSPEEVAEEIVDMFVCCGWTKEELMFLSPEELSDSQDVAYAHYDGFNKCSLVSMYDNPYEEVVLALNAEAKRREA